MIFLRLLVQHGLHPGSVALADGLDQLLARGAVPAQVWGGSLTQSPIKLTQLLNPIKKTSISDSGPSTS